MATAEVSGERRQDRSLRIALVVPAYVPAMEYGGPVTKVRALAFGLRELGHHPEIWCADYGAGRTRVRSSAGTVDGTPVRYLRRLASYRWSPVTPQALVVAARSGVDVGHCFGMWDGLTVLAAAGFRRAGIPYVVEPLGMFPAVMRNARAKRLFQTVLVDAYLGGSSALIATSRRETERLSPHTDKKVIIRENPILIPKRAARPNVLRNALGVPADGALVGWLGRISRSKGLDVLVEAMGFLPDIHLALAGPDDGDGAMETLLAAMARSGVAARVHLLGPLWEQERDEFLGSLDLFLLPSVTENFGNAAVEAAAIGLPVVVSRGVGAGEWLAELGAARISALEPVALAQAVRTALSAQVTVESSDRVRRAIDAKVSPIGVARRQVAIYRSIVDSR